jgi:hypothetical protein
MQQHPSTLMQTNHSPLMPLAPALLILCSSMVPSLKPLFRLPDWRLVRLLERAPWEQAV